MKPVCMKCFLEYHTYRVGVVVVEMASFGPYKLWNADLLQCKGCGARLVANFGEEAIHHNGDTFKAMLATAKDAHNIYYCYESVKQAREFQGH